MSVVEALRRNDPSKTTFYIRLRRETSDAALARALEQNPFVTEIMLDVDGEQRADWNSLLRVIAAHANLKKVILDDAETPEERTAPAPAGLVRAFLQAIQQNTSIRIVELVSLLRIPTDISTFVDNASSITSLIICDCDTEPTEREQGASSLAAALQRNTNIETLELSKLDDIFAIPILEGLRFNVSLKTLIFSPTSAMNVSDETSHAIHQLMESTTSIQRFELIALRFSRDTFRPIAQAITSSECVSELKLYTCRFYDRDSFAQLQSLLQNKRNLASLSLHYCTFSGGQLNGDIISILSRPDSLLRCFEFQTYASVEAGFFVALLDAIEKSKLERFTIGTIRSQQELQTLTQSIPSMKLKELEVDIHGHLITENSRQGLLQAARNNFSLRRVKGKLSDGTDFFDSDDDEQRLAFYANRNESLDQWVDNPETFDQEVWPEALSLAERAGPEALFRGLRSVLGRDYVSLPGERKRKRVEN